MTVSETPIVISQDVFAALDPLYQQIAVGLQELGKVRIEKDNPGERA